MGWIPTVRLAPTPSFRGPTMTRRSFLIPTIVLCGFAANAHAGSSNSLMDVPADGILIVANADNGTVTVVDTAAARSCTRSRSATSPKASPGSATGPLAAVTVYPRRCGRLPRRRRRQDRPETLGAAMSPTASSPTEPARRLWVTHEYPGTVSEIDLDEARRWSASWKVGNFVRGIALSPDGRPALSSPSSTPACSTPLI